MQQGFFRKQQPRTKSGNDGSDIKRPNNNNNNKNDSQNSQRGKRYHRRDQAIREFDENEEGELQIKNPDNCETYELSRFLSLSVSELSAFAQGINADITEASHKHELISTIMHHLAAEGHRVITEGTLEIMNDGYGFIRVNLSAGIYDVYLTSGQIKRAKLRTGDTISCTIRPPSEKRGERYASMKEIITLNFKNFNQPSYRRCFEDLTPIFPKDRIFLEFSGGSRDEHLSSRIIDMVAPIGRGQRALIVAPPRSGKTILIKTIAHSIAKNYPELRLIVTSIGERPEEVTDMRSSIVGEVNSSTFDESYEKQVRVSELAIEKAKRLVEEGEDVVMIIDSITRLARAYNNIGPSSGKILSGGMGAESLERPKRLFGAARSLEQGGSLTIIATALVDTGSKMDDVIFEEFKGTGNCEIVLDRRIAEHRIFPAIDIVKSGTRRDDLLIAGWERTNLLRRILIKYNPIEAMEFVLEKIHLTDSNKEFFDSMDTNPNRR